MSTSVMRFEESDSIHDASTVVTPTYMCTICVIAKSKLACTVLHDVSVGP